MTLAEYIKKYNMTVSQMAALINASDQTVYGYLCKRRTPCPAIMKRILIATNGEISANDFYLTD